MLHGAVKETLFFAQMMEIVFGKVLENIVEKGENSGNKNFLVFQLCFQRASSKCIRLILCGKPFTKQQNLRESICRRQIKCCLNDDFSP